MYKIRVDMLVNFKIIYIIQISFYIKKKTERV